MEWLAKLDISAWRGIMAAHRQPAYSDWDGQLPVTNAPRVAGQQ